MMHLDIRTDFGRSRTVLGQDRTPLKGCVRVRPKLALILSPPFDLNGSAVDEIESLQRRRALGGPRVHENLEAAHGALVALQDHSTVTEILPALHTPEVARALAAHEASHPPTHLPVGGCSTPTIWPKRPNHRKNSNQ